LVGRNLNIERLQIPELRGKAGWLVYWRSIGSFKCALRPAMPIKAGWLGRPATNAPTEPALYFLPGPPVKNYGACRLQPKVLSQNRRFQLAAGHGFRTKRCFDKAIVRQAQWSQRQV
jgi:hypothetical protein